MLSIESFDGKYIYFWYDDEDGDALVRDGKVQDAQINRAGFELNKHTQDKIEEELQQWLDSDKSNSQPS